MSRTRSACGWTVAALAFLLLAGWTGSLRADDDSALRKQAIKLNEITGEDVMLGKIGELIEDPGHAKPLLATAAKMVKDTEKDKDPPFNINATLVLARTAQLLRETDSAETLYRLYITQATQLLSYQQIGDGYAGLIRTLYEGRKYDESEKVCQEFLGLKGAPALQRLKAGVLRQMVMVLAKQGKIEKADDLIAKILKAQPDNPLNQITKAQYLMEVGKPEEAVKSYEAAIDLIKKDEDLTKEEQDDFVGNLRYALSGVYVDLKQIDKAADELKALLAKDPDNPAYNNDLGYIWADHDMNLAESEKLVRKAIEEEKKQRLKANPDLKASEVKDNPSYLDSLGWVLFKEKKYKEAKGYLEQAVKDEGGQSVEIFDHLGDVLTALGEKEAAVAVWKKALDVKGDSKREKDKKAEIEKKLKGNS